MTSSPGLAYKASVIQATPLQRLPLCIPVRPLRRREDEVNKRVEKSVIQSVKGLKRAMIKQTHFMGVKSQENFLL